MTTFSLLFDVLQMLTDDTAKSLGISSYYPYVRKAFDDILRALDVQFGRPLMMTNTQVVNKEPDDMITLVACLDVSKCF